MRSRTATALAGLAVSLLLSVALWIYFGTLVFFLVVPFVPFLFRSASGGREPPQVAECPQCGFQTRAADYEFCPRDGTRLE